jgi:periplasmic divalent cation tolerance protein
LTTEVCVVLVTAPTVELAATIGRTLVDEGLIACANLVPGVRSIYRWQGKVCDEAEVLLVLKTRSDGFEAVRARVVALHPYDVPEVVKLDVADGHAPYLAWVLGSLGDMRRP